jgi:hypothetical protein
MPEFSLRGWLRRRRLDHRCDAATCARDSGCDLLAELASKVALYQLQSKLRSLGFQEEPDIYCRWRFKNLKVDVMATEESVMNFTNRGVL